jgi:hypothetical protein
LGVSTQVSFSNLVSALTEDAKALAEAFGAETMRRLGRAGPPTPFEQAMWGTDEAMLEWKKEQLERSRRLMSGDLNALAREMRE